MIGIILKADQMAVVEEFFELFKTPWEVYRPGRAYDVVIATADEIAEVNAKLLLIYGPASKSIDARIGIDPSERHQRAVLSDGDTLLPIYQELLTFAKSSNGTSCLTAGSEMAGLKVESSGYTVRRLGYDLFDEVRFLLSVGQPIEHAHIPTLDVHIHMLREWILDARISLLEIPSAPAGHSFVVCLTHDVDFVGIRNHCFDCSMWGFIYRATVGALRNFFRGRLSRTRLFRSWLAAASLPFVYAGWARDFWEPFDWYLEAEEGLPATYFVIPFKGRPGENVPGPHASRRAAAYDVNDLQHWTAVLLQQGCEIGVHGIDAWHNVEKGLDELARINGANGESKTGIRIHWLLRDANTPYALERAGYAYDSSFGYNETIGYRAGSSQVFRPLGAETLLELPLHIQDGALFYPQRLDLSEPQAESRCQVLIDNARKFGGVLTVLWHDRSHGPERFWGEFYLRLLQVLRSTDALFATGAQAVRWFGRRREVRFETWDKVGGSGIRLHYQGEQIQPPLKIRIYTPAERGVEGESVGATSAKFIDVPWNGKSAEPMETQFGAQFSMMVPDALVCSLS